jgi:hypothetical protein
VVFGWDSLRHLPKYFPTKKVQPVEYIPPDNIKERMVPDLTMEQQKKVKERNGCAVM